MSCAVMLGHVVMSHFLSQLLHHNDTSSPMVWGQNLFGVDQYSPKRSPSPEGCLDGTSHGSRSASTDSAPESTPDASPTGFLTGSTGGCSTASRRRGEVSCH